MDVWVSHWLPDVQDEESVLIKTPMDLWTTVQAMLKAWPDEHITIVPAD